MVALRCAVAFALIFTATIAAVAGEQPTTRPAIDKPLLGHWTFDEPGAEVADAGGELGKLTSAQPVPRTRGVHGLALRLRGQQDLHTGGGIAGGKLGAISISAWVRPTELSSFREILRQECPNRILFSFQENGTILSLGLNINGYIECDAPIEPRQVLDARWHHCAATFDGQTMRVYLDGKCIGQLNRPGEISLDAATPFFAGSLAAGGEFFQGGLDDLRIYAAALNDEEIAALYSAGQRLADQDVAELDRQIEKYLGPTATFAEMMAGCRKLLSQEKSEVAADVSDAMLARLRARFAGDWDQFAALTGIDPGDYLVTRGTRIESSAVAHAVELMLEYKPLTAEQRARCTPEQLKKWDEADAIAARFEQLKAQGPAAQDSPEWIELVFRAVPYIQLRPYQSEAVAPYVRPSTPPTRTLSAQESEEAMQRDWLHQAFGNPTPQRIREEIAWTRQLAERLAARFPGKVDFTRELADLKGLKERAAAATVPDRPLYFAVRQIKRTIAFRNPLVDFKKVLFVDMPFPAGSEWMHETRHRLGYMAVPGGRLLVLDGLSPAGKLTQLMPQAPLHGSFWRPDVSFDGTKTVFCFKPHNEKSFHLYEMNIDSTGLRQLTDGIYDDLDPIYLPDGQHILFSTTRGHTYVRCMPPTNAFVLARCDRDGKDIYLVSQNNEPDYLPSVMNDGRVVYTRWEYTDKPLWRAQKLWTVNPDGTQVTTLWGNQSVWPDLMKDARAIPGSHRIMFTGSAHHNWFAGSVGIIDPHRGLNFPDGLTKVTADTPWPETGNGPVDPIESPRYHRSGDYAAYYSPYPLGEEDFLVSANRDGKFCLYLMDVEGNRELIYEGANNIFHALPVRPRPRPPLIEDRVAWPARGEQPRDGVIFSGNVYQGAPEAIRGNARALRILSIDPKTYTFWYKRPYISTGPVVSTVQSEGVKRILGTVPIEKDGSVAFYAPPGLSLHFQLLDENGRALQTMRSFVGVMPGEYRGCLGCHESHARAPVNAGMAKIQPRHITPPAWGQDTVSYPRYVQPALDRYCGKCHQGDGEARKVADLTDRPGELGFSEPYHLLIGRPSWGAPYQAPATPPPGFGIAGVLMVEGYGQTDPAAYRTPQPMTRLSYASRLVNLCSSGKHYDVKMDAMSLQRIIAWVDAMCPYNGDEEVRQIPDPIFQGVDWLSIRPLIKTAPRPLRPGPVDE